MAALSPSCHAAAASSRQVAANRWARVVACLFCLALLFLLRTATRG